MSPSWKEQEAVAEHETDLLGACLARLDIELEGLNDDVQVMLMDLELGPLVRIEDVLHYQGVQLEQLADLLHHRGVVHALDLAPMHLAWVGIAI